MPNAFLPSSRLQDYEAELAEACKRDLGKSYFEAQLADIGWCKNDIIFVTNNLEKWVKDEKAPDIPWANALLKPRIRKDPLGCVLIIGCASTSATCLDRADVHLEPSTFPSSFPSAR